MKWHSKFKANFYIFSVYTSFFFERRKKIKMTDSKKPEIFNSPNSQYFIAKISGIGPWVIRINWREGYQCGSTYMAIRMSYMTTKNAFLAIFWDYIGQPDGHISGLSLLTQGTIPEVFSKKNWELGELKISFFLNQPFWIFSFRFRTARIGQNFDDYPGFHPQTTPA